MTENATPDDRWTHLDAPGAAEGMKALGDMAAAVGGHAPSYPLKVQQGTLVDGVSFTDYRPRREVDDEHVTPYQGDSDDLVARLEWFKSQVQCVKPGRELVWSEFSEIIEVVKAVLDVNESMRNTITEMLDKRGQRKGTT